jgi:hypothetical protein
MYHTFIDLTKAFDGQSVWPFCHPPQDWMPSKASEDDRTPIKSGVKQGCVLTSTLFEIFFSMLLRYAFSESENGIFLHTRSDGNLFNLARLRAKTKMCKEILFADDAALAAHTEAALQ